jgi:hypothetical protein
MAPIPQALMSQLLFSAVSAMIAPFIVWEQLCHLAWREKNHCHHLQHIEGTWFETCLACCSTVTVTSWWAPEPTPTFELRPFIHIDFDCAHGNPIKFGDTVGIRIVLTLSRQNGSEVTEDLLPRDGVLVLVQNMHG